MKYAIQVTGEAALNLPEQDFEMDAPSGTAAADAARVRLTELAPKEGGLLDVVVSCTETWSSVTPKEDGGTITETHPPGVVSKFSFKVEPHPDVRAEVEAAAKAAEEAAAKAAEREALKAEVRLEVLAEQQTQPSVEKGVSK